MRQSARNYKYRIWRRIGVGTIYNARRMVGRFRDRFSNGGYPAERDKAENKIAVIDASSP